ncbi:glycine betaine ABC transporter substrate-binding protein [Cronbergia sp. UHCC 0137]|uniref:glycine betaine ABC transporter substrate-binding protein n=1 Tax=Cronbergia sp. UHCC 0137 TaxID=3110239 RepID=UPI002B205D4D|nr:glycine betaine ABC transporter substrate-binding protein [Cronbergia sp. UHCC 0137]MEA5616420.1 glycine betaine ABC transporter substrate-binding protein [Cronbergia sp. UHCC 0137]
MKKSWLIYCLILLLSFLTVGCQNNQDNSGIGADIVVASKDFTEQNILGELLAQQIEATTNLKVERRLNLGGTFVCHTAITSGKIDAYMEYTGTAFNGVLQQQVISDPQIVFNKVKELYNQKFQLEVMPSVGFENTFAMIIRGEDAKRYNIQTLSEAAKYTPQWKAAFGYEFMEREDGYRGLAKTYGLSFAKYPRIMSLGLLYYALQQKQVDFIVANSTDGQIARLGLVVLEDDKRYFPPYEPVPIVRQETLKKYPQLKTAIAQLSGKISADEIRELNYLVEGELRDIKQVVQEFRQTKNFGN